MSAVESFLMITQLFGGLAMFLFGMSLMSDSLTDIAGKSFKGVIEKATKGKVRGYAFGTTVTALVQSSSTTTVMVVGFVNAGLLTLLQAAPVILGANLGTTATAWLLSLNGVGGESLIMTIIKPANFSPLLAIISVFIMMFGKSEKKKKIATVIFGFALLMMGMSFMSSAVGPLKSLPAFKNLLTSFANPALGYVVAVIFTMIIQSCDATVGIVQALAMGVGVTYGTCIPLICGAQMGTCITSILSSIGGSKNGRRAAFIHLFYNIFKTVTFMLAFYGLDAWLHFSFLDAQASLVGIALVHSLINILFSFIVLPASGLLIKLVMKVLPMSDAEKDMDEILSLLDSRFYKTPSFAIEQAKVVMNRVADMITEGYSHMKNIRENKDAPTYNFAAMCENVNIYCEKTKDYLSRINEASLSDTDESVMAITRDACINFEIMMETATELQNRHNEFYENGIQLPEDAEKEQLVLEEAMGEILAIVMNGFKNSNPSFVKSTSVFREVIFDLGEKIQREAIERLHDDIYDHNHQMLINTNINSIDQVVSCCDNIGRSIATNLSKNKKLMISRDDEKQMQIITDLFRDKYKALEK